MKPRLLPILQRLLPTLLFAATLAPLIGCGNSGQAAATLSGALTFSTLTTTPSASQVVTISNIGLIPVNIKSVAVAGTTPADFTETDTCKGTLAVGNTCPVTIAFASATAGTFTATLTVTDNTSFGGVQSVLLTGTAVVPTPAVTLSSTSQTFGPFTAGSASTIQTTTLTNSGSAALALSSVSLTGTGAALFAQSNNCPASLAPAASCALSLTFAPKVAGTYSATLTLADNAASGTQTVALAGTATPAALAIDTTIPTDWKISNGTLTLDWNSVNGHIFAIHLAGYADNLADTTSSNAGIYMDNSGLGTGTSTATYTNAGGYLDWSITTASSSTNAYTCSEHFVITPNDPGIHLYFVANHSATDIAGGIGQVQWVYRSNLTDFPNTYSVNPDLSNPGPVAVPPPPASENFSTDPGRAVSDATVDLHGLPVPTGFTRSFYTKYDYSSYNYLHQAHGTYGSTFGAWAYFPSNESLVGGPTKQNLIFTGNLIILEAYSNHYDNPLTLTTPAGTASSRLFGPFYLHFNSFGQAYNSTGNTLATPADMYQDAVTAGAVFQTFYDSEAQLVASGYTPSSARGSVAVQVAGVTGTAKTSWAVLSDPKTNVQFSSQGNQYWADISSTGAANFTGVKPGTYRLSVYSLGQWGELRQDNVVVNANETTTVPALSFVPENFGSTVFTIGAADRSSHEFLHGHDAAGHDDREFWGTWNYWSDFAANNGAVVYNATAGPNGAATNDLSQWNYDHWGTFNPGLYGGVYVAADDTKDGYTYAIPPYVASLTGASGTNGVLTRTPTWQVHFATPANIANYQYAVLSVALACDYGSYVATLNGTARTWGYRNTIESDCAVRSGLSGYTLWLAFQFPASALKAAGLDNVLSLGVSQTYGAMDDALRLELTNTSAAPSVTGWNDYEFIGTSSTAANVPANDTVPNP